ncbi:hypothetical protein HNQ98_000092 [Leuconostoc carnosum]|nr:hypothetical protein [Leuconostoc carnosum]
MKLVEAHPINKKGGYTPFLYMADISIIKV